jgi:hypothetical protein
MRRLCLALIAGLVAACALASAAVADSQPPGVPPIQTAGQVAASGQYADSSASSAQIAPKNTNVDVRVLSPGSNGPVTQANTSTAAAIAANANSTDQDTTQDGSGLQQAAQTAGNLQGASATADSTQVKPENTNVDVRVLSEGDDGPVEQTNASTAAAIAANLNHTDQDVSQAADGPAGQTAAQAALSKQGSAADATSKQIAPKNTNVGVRVLSPGNNGAVTQHNDSTAKAIAANLNKTDQDVTQAAPGYGSGQTAGQIAGNLQDARSSAQSAQIHPSNTNADVRVLSPGHSGDVTQANTSTALGVALNANKTEQEIGQQGLGDGGYGCCSSDHKDGVAVQAAGQQAGNIQSATVCCAESIQVHPENTNISTGDGGSTTQSNSSTALGVAANLNGLEQEIGQGPAEEKDASAPAPTKLEGVTDGLAEAGPADPGEVDGDSEATTEAAPAPRPAGTVQSNESKAISLALNLNKTEQSIWQGQSGRPADVGVQAAGQLAGNEQHASSSAASIQYGAENRNGSFGLPYDECKKSCGPYGKPYEQPSDGCKDTCEPHDGPYGKPYEKPYGKPYEKPYEKPSDGCKQPCGPYDPCGHDGCKPAPCDTGKRGDWDRCPKPTWCGRDKRPAPPQCRPATRDEVMPQAG